MKAYTNTLHVQFLLRCHSPFLAVFFPAKTTDGPRAVRSPMTTHAPTRHSRDLGVCTKLCREFHASGNIGSRKVFQTDFKHRKSSRTWELINGTLTWVLVVVWVSSNLPPPFRGAKTLYFILLSTHNELCIEVVNIDCTKGLPLGLFCIINHNTKSALTPKCSERDEIGFSQKQEKKQDWSAKRESKLHVWQANNNACAWFFSRPHPLVV